ncbi:MAG: hydroxyacid dehydrogenase [Bdellovibrionaceae bacterium]|nr:hydroxyacid dehydrogenase [Bdellovibrio sp.]
MCKKILIADRFAVEALIELKKNKNFEIETYAEEKLVTANAVIIRSKLKIDAKLLEKAKNLEVIVTCTSGYDHIDLKETEKRGIQVMYTPEANVTSAAEHTWALIMTCVRQIVAANKELKSGTWSRDPYLAFELESKILGIVGLGRIGQRVARMALAFDMQVIAFDPYQDENVFTKLNVRRQSYDEVLKQADILTFHVPATFETNNMFNRSHYESVDEHLILINTSRGAVINEDDLVLALQQKQIRMAALDVFAKEPLGKESKLLKCQNAILTPHLGAYTEEAFLKASMQAAELLTNYFNKKLLMNSLPLKNEWGSMSFKERT